MAISDETTMLAFSVCSWLTSKGCIVSLTRGADEIHIHYTLALDVKPQPPVTIKNQSVIFPHGSQEDVIFSYLEDTYRRLGYE